MAHQYNATVKWNTEGQTKFCFSKQSNKQTKNNPKKPCLHGEKGNTLRTKRSEKKMITTLF